MYRNGVGFRFKLPRGTNLSLRAVDCKNGIPKLRFSTAPHNQNMSSITEEDAAVCVKLALDNKRPEFFYAPFLPNHPFASFERHYMQYKPAYLKGTSVGELFAEADWKMKSLQVGVLSDAEKQNFKSWCNSSKLKGLETSDKFPSEKDSGQVLMTCESVDVSDTKDELLFVGEPKMKITATSNPGYSSYITEHFDSIAFHDEPTFMKMKEIVKLVLAIEWLRDKGVTFSEEWVESHCSKPKNKSQKAVKVDFSEEEKAEILEKFKSAMNDSLAKLDTASHLQLQSAESTDVSVTNSCPQISVEQFSTQSSDSGIEIKFTETFTEPVLKALTGLHIPVVVNVTGRVTLDDYDFLYQGLDLKMPITVDRNDGFIKPDADSFNELYAQTMPIPACVIPSNDDEDKKVTILAGGCTTASIPVKKTVLSSVPVRETATVKGSIFQTKRQKVVCAPSDKMVAPPTNTLCKTISSNSGSSSQTRGQRLFGMIDNTSRILSTGDGQVAEKRPSLTGVIIIKQLIGGEEVGSPIFLNMHLGIPTCKAITSALEKDSAYSSKQSLVAN